MDGLLRSMKRVSVSIEETEAAIAVRDSVHQMFKKASGLSGKRRQRALAVAEKANTNWLNQYGYIGVVSAGLARSFLLKPTSDNAPYVVLMLRKPIGIGVSRVWRVPLPDVRVCGH